MKNKLVVLVLLFLVVSKCWSQGFINFNFEAANISGSSGIVSASNAIPSWTAYIGGVSQGNILYDSETLSDPAVSLQDTNNFYPIIEGAFSVLLQGQFNPSHNLIYTNSVAIGQTGLIPSMAATLLFSAEIFVGGPHVANMVVTFNGQNLNYTQIGSGAGFSIYGADISAFASQTGQLLFTVPYNGSVLLDNIQFSTSPVPEPSPLAFLAVGASLLGWRLRKTN